MRVSTVAAILGGVLVASAIGGGGYLLLRRKAPAVTSTAPKSPQAQPAQAPGNELAQDINAGANVIQALGGSGLLDNLFS